VTVEVPSGPPTIQIVAPDVTSTQPTDTQATEILTIDNIGGLDLDWTID
jgi:hypothetical protein